jgi:hypothetical protein
MKLYKFVSYASLAVALMAVILLITAPMRIPGTYFYWKPAVLLLSPAVVLVILLFTKPHLPGDLFLALMISLAGLAILGTIFGWMSPIILGILLAACFGLSIPNRPCFKEDKR